MTKSAQRSVLTAFDQFSSARPALCRIAPFATYVLFMAISDLLMKHGWSGDALRWLYPVKIAAVTLVLLICMRRYDELRIPTDVPLKTWVVTVLAGAFVFFFWIHLDAPWMKTGTTAGFDPRDANGINWRLTTSRLFGAIVIVPLMEELFWRSFLLRWLVNSNFLKVAPARTGLLAFTITAIFFAIEHDLWLAGLLAGVVFNLLYMRTGTLWAPIIAHAAANALLGAWVLHTENWTFW